MKGFMYLLEISVAMILIIVVLGTISGFKSKENWERADLISTANYISNQINSSDIINFLSNNTSKIDAIKPKNVGYALSIFGVPKSNISVGCVNYCNDVRSMLTPMYINSRWVNFSVQQFDPEALNYIPPYDAIVLVNYTNYGTRKVNITDYLENGGIVIGINGTYSNNDPDFNQIFGLNLTSSTSGNFTLSKHDSATDSTKKYFTYSGFDINTSNSIGSKKWGYWYIWDVSRAVNISSNTVDIENKSADEGFMLDIPEGGSFRLKSPLDGIFYSFRVSKIFWDSFVIIQPMNYSMTFKDFSESSDVRGTFNILSLPSGQAEMSSNGSAVWISDFPASDEYRTLVKAAIASRATKFDAINPDNSKKYIALSSFYPMCCNAPETAKLTLYLWYRI